ncbi:putative metalloprotease CJM1_0395 family protein [Halomonas faecis]|uniref:putative metalloprotease CJM1_0395 family protein n=1 Tax=Halomonas faecis TaxID=1562110 RepID=UPI0013CFE0B4|nr:putative metalloprotease CJM1_0395 family protein [Halomonas faecis]
MQASPVTGTVNLAFSANAASPSVNDTAIGRTETRRVGEPGAGAATDSDAAEEARHGNVSQGEAIEKPNGETLSEAELRELERLKQTDQEIRRHEMAHQVAGGAYTGTATYEFERGPDGQRYAVAGEVPIDYGPVRGDPRATIDKMQQVISAALAPADPSPKDRQVAATARQYLLTAQLELAQQQSAMNGARQAGQTRAEPVDIESSETPSLSRFDIVARAAQASGSDSLKA